jgi:hypothetical protein
MGKATNSLTRGKRPAKQRRAAAPAPPAALPLPPDDGGVSRAEFAYVPDAEAAPGNALAALARLLRQVGKRSRQSGGGVHG